ncbi:MAG TPA: SRPBCC family protein [Gemmatimonadaceae bacterium]|jgi:uncharacterized membrane protein
MSRKYPRVTADPAAKLFEIVIEIAAPPQRVWDVTTDIERWPDWTASVKSVRRIDSGKFRVGSRAKIKQPKFLPAIWEVTELKDGRSFTWVTQSPGLKATGRHRVEPISGGSRATLSVTYSGALSGIVTKLLGPTTERFLTLEANGLKKQSESASPPRPTSPSSS